MVNPSCHITYIPCMVGSVWFHPNATTIGWIHWFCYSSVVPPVIHCLNSIEPIVVQLLLIQRLTPTRTNHLYLNSAKPSTPYSTMIGNRVYFSRFGLQFCRWRESIVASWSPWHPPGVTLLAVPQGCQGSDGDGNRWWMPSDGYG